MARLLLACIRHSADRERGACGNASRRCREGHQGLAWPLPATFASGSGTRAPRIAHGDALLGYLPAANISARSLLLLLTYHTIKITGLQQVTASCVGDTAPPPWPVTPAADKREVPEFIVYYHVHNGQ